MNVCPCGSSQNYDNCCKIIHDDVRLADTAEKLMRARYSAFKLHLVDFIYDSFYWKSRKKQIKKEIDSWATSNQWIKLEIIYSDETHVEFKAYYINSLAQIEIHHELSTFRKDNDIWYYVDGKFPKQSQTNRC